MLNIIEGSLVKTVGYTTFSNTYMEQVVKCEIMTPYAINYYCQGFEMFCILYITFNE